MNACIPSCLVWQGRLHLTSLEWIHTRPSWMVWKGRIIGYGPIPIHLQLAMITCSRMRKAEYVTLISVTAHLWNWIHCTNKLGKSSIGWMGRRWLRQNADRQCQNRKKKVQTISRLVSVSAYFSADTSVPTDERTHGCCWALL